MTNIMFIAKQLTSGALSLCQRGDHEVADTSGSCTMTHQGDCARVSPELGNIPLDPLQGGHLVKQAEVTGNMITHPWLQEPWTSVLAKYV